MAKLTAADRLDQGAVLDEIPWGVENPPLGIVLTSTCDLEWGRADFLTFAALKPAKAIVQASKEFRAKLQGANGDQLTKDAWNSLVVRLKSLVHNANVERYFFLDAEEALGLPPLLADFQHLVSVPMEKARSLPIRAAVSTPHREKLITHFSAYSARIGVERQPEGDAEVLVALLAEPYHGPAAHA